MQEKTKDNNKYLDKRKETFQTNTVVNDPFDSILH